MSIGAMLANLKIHKLPNLKIRLVTYERRYPRSLNRGQP